MSLSCPFCHSPNVMKQIHHNRIQPYPVLEHQSGIRNHGSEVFQFTADCCAGTLIGGVLNSLTEQSTRKIYAFAKTATKNSQRIFITAVHIQILIYKEYIYGTEQMAYVGDTPWHGLGNQQINLSKFGHNRQAWTGGLQCQLYGAE